MTVFCLFFFCAPSGENTCGRSIGGVRSQSPIKQLLPRARMSLREVMLCFPFFAFPLPERNVYEPAIPATFEFPRSMDTVFLCESAGTQPHTHTQAVVTARTRVAGKLCGPPDRANARAGTRMMIDRHKCVGIARWWVGGQQPSVHPGSETAALSIAICRSLGIPHLTARVPRHITSPSISLINIEIARISARGSV